MTIRCCFPAPEHGLPRRRVRPGWAAVKSAGRPLLPARRKWAVGGLRGVGLRQQRRVLLAIPAIPGHVHVVAPVPAHVTQAASGEAGWCNHEGRCMGVFRLTFVRVRALKSSAALNQVFVLELDYGGALHVTATMACRHDQKRAHTHSQPWSSATCTDENITMHASQGSCRIKVLLFTDSLTCSHGDGLCSRQCCRCSRALPVPAHIHNSVCPLGEPGRVLHSDKDDSHANDHALTATPAPGRTECPQKASGLLPALSVLHIAPPRTEPHYPRSSPKQL